MPGMHLGIYAMIPSAPLRKCFQLGSAKQQIVDVRQKALHWFDCTPLDQNHPKILEKAFTESGQNEKGLTIPTLGTWPW